MIWFTSDLHFNHEAVLRMCERPFAEVHKLTEIHVGVGGQNHSITLCHFPMMSWYKSNHGSLHLHGHIHSKGDEYNLDMRESGIRHYDVGVDANNYEPVSLEEILKYLITEEVE